MDRRKFIRQGCTACLSATLLSTLAPSCAPTRYTGGKLGKDGLTLSADEFITRQAGRNSYRSFLIVRNEALKFPICVFRFSEKEYSALWMECTHQGAELQASGDYLQCPAHGSEFDSRGTVKNGPAGRNLRNFPVTVTGTSLFIDLRAV